MKVLIKYSDWLNVKMRFIVTFFKFTSNIYLLRMLRYLPYFCNELNSSGISFFLIKVNAGIKRPTENLLVGKIAFIGSHRPFPSVLVVMWPSFAAQLESIQSVVNYLPISQMKHLIVHLWCESRPIRCMDTFMMEDFRPKYSDASVAGCHPCLLLKKIAYRSFKNH